MFTELEDRELEVLISKMWRGAFIFCDEEIPMDINIHREVLAVLNLLEAEKLWRLANA